MPTIQIPRQLRKYTQHQEFIEISGVSVIELLKKLIDQFPELGPYILDPSEKVCSFINVYINNKDIRFLENENTVVYQTDVINIIPALAGG